MKTRTVARLVVLLTAILFTGDVLAAQRRRRGRSRKPNPEAVKRAKEQAEREQQELHNQHIAQLPPSIITIPELSTDQFDKVKKTLHLSAEQEQKIDALKDELSGKRKGLLKEQEDARDAFRRVKESDCARVATRVNTALNACKAFSPNTAFRSRLDEILTPAQRIPSRGAG